MIDQFERFLEKDQNESRAVDVDSINLLIMILCALRVL